MTVVEKCRRDGLQPRCWLTSQRLYTENYRKILIRATGKDPGKLANAHHIYPQRFEGIFTAKGINIHDPKNLAWWERSNHGRIAQEYNRAWKGFFFEKNPNASKEQIMKDGERLMSTYKDHLF